MLERIGNILGFLPRPEQCLGRQLLGVIDSGHQLIQTREVTMRRSSHLCGAIVLLAAASSASRCLRSASSLSFAILAFSAAIFALAALANSCLSFSALGLYTKL